MYITQKRKPLPSTTNLKRIQYRNTQNVIVYLFLYYIHTHSQKSNFYDGHWHSKHYTYLATSYKLLMHSPALSLHELYRVYFFALLR